MEEWVGRSELTKGGTNRIDKLLFQFCEKAKIRKQAENRLESIERLNVLQLRARSCHDPEPQKKVDVPLGKDGRGFRKELTGTFRLSRSF